MESKLNYIYKPQKLNIVICLIKDDNYLEFIGNNLLIISNNPL